MRYFFLMSVFLKLVTSEEYSQMQAIFIENFDPVDFQENDTDLELLPRVSRTFETDNSKEYFFRQAPLSFPLYRQKLSFLLMYF